jgi:hypothetical protein
MTRIRPEEDLRLLLDLHRHFELLLGDEPVRDEEVPRYSRWSEEDVEAMRPSAK